MLVLSFMIALFSCNYTPVLPTAIIPLSLLLTIIFYIPNGIITATTSMGLVMGTPSDLISGHLLSGNPVAFLAFRTFTFTCQDQIIIYLTNAKIAHYMK
ncbi:unnamed protein product, partial [Rotaria magnacalcarata]